MTSKRQTSIAYLGPRHTFSHMAARERRIRQRVQGDARYVTLVGFNTIEEVFAAVERGECECGVVPYENNTLKKRISDTEASLHSHPHLEIKEKIDQPIEFCVGTLFGLTPEIVASKDKAIQQCTKYIDAIGANTCDTDSTGAAAKLLSRFRNAKEDLNGKTWGAIASEKALIAANLVIVARDVGDKPKASNVTTFAVIAPLR